MPSQKLWTDLTRRGHILCLRGEFSSSGSSHPFELRLRFKVRPKSFLCEESAMHENCTHFLFLRFGEQQNRYEIVFLNRGQQHNRSQGFRAVIVVALVWKNTRSVGWKKHRAVKMRIWNRFRGFVFCNSGFPNTRAVQFRGGRRPGFCRSGRGRAFLAVAVRGYQVPSEPHIGPR